VAAIEHTQLVSSRMKNSMVLENGSRTAGRGAVTRGRSGALAHRADLAIVEDLDAVSICAR
jgi:hypothetical protein